jgi:hypothetical protein
MISLKSFPGKKKCLAFVSAAMVSATMMGAIGFSEASFAQSEPRQPPPTRSSEVLSDRVYRAIAEIQELMNPEDTNKQPDLERAKRALDTLNERYSSMNDFEKSTLLNFYTNYYLSTDNVTEALKIFERILTIENLRVEMRLRSLQALGQLYAGEDRYRESIDALTRWREISEEENEMIFLLLVNAHYNLEEFAIAIPFLVQHMDMLAAQGKPIPRNIYSLMFQMQVELEDYRAAEVVARQMVVLFDEPQDWRNLAAVYGMLDNDKNRVETLALTYQKGYMQNEAEYMNLAQSLAGSDAPYQGAKVLKKGMEEGIVEQRVENLERLTQMYLMASEYEMALEPARRAAEMGESGDAYDYLGYIYVMLRDYKSAADAIKMALQRGGLKNPGETQLFLARALLEIEDYNGTAAAAQEAQRLGSNGARQYLTHIERQREWRANLDRRKADAIEFYRS